MSRRHVDQPFERYADEAVVHCRTYAAAIQLREDLAKRLSQCGLELHPTKTRIVYGADDNRPGAYPDTSFDFLGYTFRPRAAVNQREGGYFTSFLPAVSRTALTAMRQVIHSWHVHLQGHRSLSDLAEEYNPVIRGWLQYYGRFYRSGLEPLRQHIDRVLVRWARRKYKRLRRHHRRAAHWLQEIAQWDPQLFVHW